MMGQPPPVPQASVSEHDHQSHQTHVMRMPFPASRACQHAQVLLLHVGRLRSNARPLMYGALIIRIGFWGVPYYIYSIVYPKPYSNY